MWCVATRTTQRWGLQHIIAQGLDNCQYTERNVILSLLYIAGLFGYCKGGNFNFHIWAWFGYFNCSRMEIRFYPLVKRLKVAWAAQVCVHFMKNCKWVWSGNTTITNCRQPRGTARKSRSTITRHQEDKLSKAISSLFPIKMIAILEWT